MLNAILSFRNVISCDGPFPHERSESKSPRSHGATHSSVSALLMIVSGKGKECLFKGDIIWCQLFKIDLWLRIINFSSPLPDHGSIQAILSHDTAPAPRFARLSLLCSSILKPHLRNIRIFFAHLSRPWSIGWVALSFLVRLSVRPSVCPAMVASDQISHFFQYIRA